MAGKSLNLLDECVATCVYLPSQEEECTSSSWGDSRMYTSGSKTNSQGIPNETNKNGAIAKVIILVEKVTLRYLKTFRIVSNENSF